MANLSKRVTQLYGDLERFDGSATTPEARVVYNKLLSIAKDQNPDDEILKALNPVKGDIDARTLRVLVGQIMMALAA